MEIKDYSIKEALKVFGVSPEYRVEYSKYGKIRHMVDAPPSFKYRPEYFADTILIKELHLNRHEVTLENGHKIVANFAVDHESKTVYVKLTEIDGGSVVYWVYANG